MTAPALEVIGMTKRFGTLRALSDASLRVAAGSVHALLGENGAGKSTLVKCIMGYYRADEGAVVLDGREVSLRSPREAQAGGIGMVYQHFTLVPSLTVLENLVMARRTSPGRINWKAERTRLETFLTTMPFHPPLDVSVSALSAGEKQKAEILKQLYLQSRFLILDEPTSVLTPNEADDVLGLVRTMAHAGRITVLIITHKFREVFTFADQVTVLRRGQIEGGGAVADLTPDALARLMVGDAGLVQPAPRERGLRGEVRMELRNLSAHNDAGEPALRAVSLRIAAGEIVGIAGVSGNGQAELVQVLAGQRRATGGMVLMHGQPYQATRAEIVRHRVALLPEEPLRNACVGRMCVAENMAFRTFDRAPMANGIWLRPGRMRAMARELVERYRVQTASVDAPIATLSGGNVQRAVLARELSTAADVLIVANPVFGLDFAAVADIRSQIMAARRRGTAILLVSEDLDELMEMADRIVVIAGGGFVHETPAVQADRMEIGRYMAGHHAVEAA